ncbi:MAG: MFS transporter, partial [Pseudomonadota bacterium]
TVIMTAVEESQSGVASGINNLAARMAGLLAIAALTSLAVYWFRGELNQALGTLPLSDDSRAQLLARAHELAGIRPTSVDDDTVALREAIQESYVAVFRQLMFLCAGLAATAAVIAWSTIRQGSPQPS